MAFGTILQSFAAPTAASSLKTCAWDGAHLICGDALGGTRIVWVDLATKLITQTYSDDIGAISGKTFFWDGAELVITDGIATVSTWRPDTGQVTQTMVTADSGAFLSIANAGMGIYGVRKEGGVSLWARTAPTWTMVWSTQPVAFAGAGITAATTSDAHLYLGSNTSPRNMIKLSRATMTLVSSVAAPVDVAMNGLAYTPGGMWVGIGGTTDRYYQVEP